ncbi:CPBP family intramembrane glutamic endopeptidase [Hyphobacterium marinum]|uniref:CPBP family intramembrane glutamic endopeptidase n=1 Tax=Hyphobacterium marinum TaxID=3116574 RepID=A0ABU7LU47_9PROT|nr:CPBP family intramembrane glutamic endopeptidase [Hyphobacterium sp. Y6023]MEE2565084.1 CPBP family intramembrane glutamic endopeptidase [Hyphobacterium sp. Y6023]
MSDRTPESGRHDKGLAGSWPRWLIAVVTLAVFFTLDHFAWLLFGLVPDGLEGTPYLAALFVLRWLPWLIVPALVAALFFGPRQAASALGLTRSPLTGLAFAAAVTLILPIVYAVASPVGVAEEPAEPVLRYALFPGVFEEILYRGFLFGFLFRFARWGFLPAALVGALVFGAAHFSAGGDLNEALTIFAITAIGGFWFAWLYAEWDFNLWIPISLHVLMNAWWELFVIADNAAGTQATIIARFAVIGLSILLTLALARWRGPRRIRGRDWLYRPGLGTDAPQA